MDTLTELLKEQLQDLYSAEKQLVKALPALAKKASTPALEEAFQTHLDETKEQVQRLETIGETLGIRLAGKTCKAMEGLIEEGKEVVKEKGRTAVIDVALVGAAQRVEHYEIAAYGAARTLAEHLGHDEVTELLQKTLDEESAADEKLTEVCMNSILPEADSGAEEEEGDAEEETAEGKEPVSKPLTKRSTGR
jgi:ferritin-like metal-binding protein YciE